MLIGGILRIKDVEIEVVNKIVDQDKVSVFVDHVDEVDIDVLRSTVKAALYKLDEQGKGSIAFAILCCGKGELPFEHSSKVMAQQVFKYVKEVEDPNVKRIIFAVENKKAYEVFKRNVEGYLGYMVHKGLLGPYVTVDGIVEHGGGIVLIERSNPPLGYALPGGFVDYNESVEDAVVREIKEETNLDFTDIKLFKVSSDPDRDPRFHTVSVIFSGVGKGTLCAGDDAANAHVIKSDNIPDTMAFDHREIIEEYLVKLK